MKKVLNQDKSKRVIVYILTLLSLLLFLSFYMRYGEQGFPTSFPIDYRTGIYYVFQRPLDEFISVKIAFLLFGVQLAFYAYRVFSRKILSSIFNILTILCTSSGVFLIYVSMYHDNYGTQPVYYYLIILLVLIVIVCVFDMIMYPIEHDYITEVPMLRRIVAIVFASVLGLFFISVMDNIGDGYDLDISEYGIFISWIVFVIVTPFIRTRFYESRLSASLYLLLPASLFTLFYISHVLESGYDFEWQTLLISFILLIPSAVVNIDFVINNFRNLDSQLNE